jgi:hypothetical protein
MVRGGFICRFDGRFLVPGSDCDLKFVMFPCDQESERLILIPLPNLGSVKGFGHTRTYVR